VFAQIVDQEHPAEAVHLAGIVIIRSVTRAINRGTKDSRVQSAKKRIEQQHIRKW